MKATKLKGSAFGLALLALTQAQAAQAQSCLEPQDLNDAIIYSMPVLVETFERSCGASLREDGFFATRGEEFVAPYLAMQSERWPGALRLLKVFAGTDEDAREATALFDALPEEALRPFVDGIVAQMVGKEIKQKDCSRIERGVELLSPLPPENVGGLLTFIVEMAGKKEPRLCSRDEQ